MHSSAITSLSLPTLFLAAILCAAVSCEMRCVAEEEPVTAITLRFDGVYQSEKSADYWNYLRLYADGTVITVSSSGTPEEISKWFARKHDAVSAGKYTVSGTRITFTVESKDGKIDYDGQIRGERIQLQTISHINGHKGEKTFTFKSVTVSEK